MTDIERFEKDVRENDSSLTLCTICMYNDEESEGEHCSNCTGAYSNFKWRGRNNEEVPDVVNNPEHYTHGIECIEEMIGVFGEEAVMTFCLLNVWKYRKRAIYKNGTQDMEKADWYMKKYLELKEG